MSSVINGSTFHTAAKIRKNIAGAGGKVTPSTHVGGGGEVSTLMPRCAKNGENNP